jgi:hypothetical protein
MKKLQIPKSRLRRATREVSLSPEESFIIAPANRPETAPAPPFTVSPPVPPKTDSKQKPVYSVVIIYQDTETAARGNSFSNVLMRELGESILWTTDSWSMDELDLPDVRRAAIEAAAIADVVIFSLEGRAELPDGIKAWLEEWGGRLFDWSPILIALFNATGEEQEALASTRTFFGMIADACGLTFLHTSGKSSIVEYRPSAPASLHAGI